MKIEYATRADREELLAFLLAVFREGNPNHLLFEDIYPDLFLPDDEILGRHALIREDGKIVACVGTYPVLMQNSGRRILTAGVGQVATLRKARGKGYMSLLLNNELNRCREEGVAYAWLGGRRDRYAHFGFDCAGCNIEYRCDASSLRKIARARTVTCADATLPGAISDSMMALREKTCNSAIVPADTYRLQMKRAGFKFEVYASFKAGEEAPDAWAVVDTDGKRIEDWCGSLEGRLEILHEAAGKLGGVSRIESPAAADISLALRNCCAGCSPYWSHISVLDAEKILATFPDFVPAGFRIPADGDKCALARAIFGPGFGCAMVPHYIPGLFHV